MSDEMKDYVDNFRANLPAGITYDSGIARYFCNGRRFLNEWEVSRYLAYIKKFGFSVIPEALFENGENGVQLEPFDLTTLYQDSAGTTAVTTAGDPVGLIEDKSGNTVNATQATSAARPTYNTSPARIALDGVDDNMAIDFGAAFTGTVLQGTPNGTIHMEIDDADGAWNLTVDPAYVPDGGDITGLIAVEGTPSASEISQTKKYLQNNGAGVDFAGVTSMSGWFRDRTDITAIYSGDWNTSSVTDFRFFAYGCSNLTTLDVSNWNTSSVKNFRFFAYDCTSLTTLDVSNWNTSSVTDFNRFAYGCSSLTTLDVSGWDTSSVTNFNFFARNCPSLTTITTEGGTGDPFADSPCTNYINAFDGTNLDQASIDNILVRIESAGTSNGTFDQSGGSAPSATGEAAVTALRGRGWTVTVTGGF